MHLCILCGCDYCSTIKGIGPKTALKLIRECKTIEQYFYNVYLYSPIVVIVIYALGIRRRKRGLFLMIGESVVLRLVRSCL
jgi:5'-3' exonuclease